MQVEMLELNQFFKKSIFESICNSWILFISIVAHAHQSWHELQEESFSKWGTLLRPTDSLSSKHYLSLMLLLHSYLWNILILLFILIYQLFYYGNYTFIKQLALIWYRYSIYFNKSRSFRKFIYELKFIMDKSCKSDSKSICKIDFLMLCANPTCNIIL